jgi:DNA-binding response OmpR family regulator
MRALLAEDNPDHAKIFKRLLEQCGFAVTVVDKLSSASKELLEKKFDLCLLDCRLKNGDATAAIKILENTFCKVRIVAMSSLNTGSEGVYPKDEKILKNVINGSIGSVKA